MQHKAISILKRHGVMALATVRKDGWPQATMVGYVNDGFALYFLISRTSQKFRNIAVEERVSIAIGVDRTDPEAIEGLSMAAFASEVRDEPYRSQFCSRLAERHPGYFDPDQLDFKASALMRARAHVITIVDFSKGLGHAEAINLGPDDLVFMEPARSDNWGPNPGPMGEAAAPAPVIAGQSEASPAAPAQLVAEAADRQRIRQTVEAGLPANDGAHDRAS